MRYIWQPRNPQLAIITCLQRTATYNIEISHSIELVTNPEILSYQSRPRIIPANYSRRSILEILDLFHGDHRAGHPVAGLVSLFYWPNQDTYLIYVPDQTYPTCTAYEVLGLIFNLEVKGPRSRSRGQIYSEIWWQILYMIFLHTAVNWYWPNIHHIGTTYKYEVLGMIIILEVKVKVTVSDTLNVIRVFVYMIFSTRWEWIMTKLARTNAVLGLIRCWRSIVLVFMISQHGHWQNLHHMYYIGSSLFEVKGQGQTTSSLCT